MTPRERSFSRAWSIEPLLTWPWKRSRICFRVRPFSAGLKSLEDAIGDGVCDAGAEEGGRGLETVVPQGEGRLQVRQPDEGAAVKRGVEGTDAQHLCFGATGGGAVEARSDLAQGRVVVVPELAGGRVAAKEDFGLALCPLDGTSEAAAMADSSCGSTLPPSGRHWTRSRGPKTAVGETVVGFGAVERLGEFALGDVTDEAEVASAGLHEAITVEHAQGSAIPGAAQQGESWERLRPMVCSTEASSSASTSRRRSPACCP